VTQLLTLPQGGYSGLAGGTIAGVPVTLSPLDDAQGHTGLVGAMLVLTFPTGVFDFPIGDLDAGSLVHAGALLPPGWSLSANCPQDGLLLINVSCNTPGNELDGTSGGELVLVDFPVAAAAPSGDQPLSLVARSGIHHTHVLGLGSKQYVLQPPLPYMGILTVQ